MMIIFIFPATFLGCLVCCFGGNNEFIDPGQPLVVSGFYTFLASPAIQIMEAGAAPQIAARCDEIKLADTINQLVMWDDKQCKLSPGTRIEAIIINVLSARKPLYKIESYYEQQAPEVL